MNIQRSLFPKITVLALACLALPTPALADRHVMKPGKPLPAYEQECGACHLAYQPGLLPGNAWEKMMGTLDRHYGTDATLDPQTLTEIQVWLQQNAGYGKRARQVPPENRITRADWFVRKHRGIDPAVWKHESVASPANCAACHPNAAKGDYEEDSLVYPRGLPTRFKRGWEDDD